MDLRASSRERRLIGLLAAAAAVLLLASGVLAALATGALGGPPAFHGTAWEPPHPAADFRLTEHTGRTVGIDDYRGRAVLLFFGYANCPDVCPITLAKLDRVLDGMRADTAEVEVLLVTVDPERDSPAALAEYVRRFGPWVSGLTGDPEALAAMRRDYFAFAEPAEAPAVQDASHAGHAAPRVDFSHSPQVFGIDRAGLVRVLLPMERTEEEIAADVRTLLRL